MPLLRPLQPWLRRGLEAGVVTGLVTAGTLVASGFGPGSEGLVLPAGAAGILALAPGLLAIGVVAVGYPVAFAATRSDAILGAITAVLIAADLAIILASGRVLIADREFSAGLLTAGLAAGPAVLGLLTSQLVGLGFGRRPGSWSVIISTVGAILVLAIVGVVR